MAPLAQLCLQAHRGESDLVYAVLAGIPSSVWSPIATKRSRQVAHEVQARLQSPGMGWR